MSLYTFYMETKNISSLFSRALSPLRVLNPQHTAPLLSQAGITIKLLVLSLPPDICSETEVSEV